MNREKFETAKALDDQIQKLREQIIFVRRATGIRFISDSGEVEISGPKAVYPAQSSVLMVLLDKKERLETEFKSI